MKNNFGHFVTLLNYAWIRINNTPSVLIFGPLCIFWRNGVISVKLSGVGRIWCRHELSATRLRRRRRRFGVDWVKNVDIPSPAD